jgi:ubiquinone/menaquinone biosynthesis C-methylase UbiE
MWQKYIDGQYRRPTGIVGRWIGGKMAQQHVPENTWTVNLLGVQPTDHILEIGFGPGIAIQEAASHASQGYIAGIDYSKTMVNAAKKRNAAAVQAGRVDLRYGDAAQLPFTENTFDKAFSIHSIYFWPDPTAVIAGIHRVLKHGGWLVLTIMPKELWNPENPDAAGTPECKPYYGEELKILLETAGFQDTRIEADSRRELESNYSVLGRK